MQQDSQNTRLLWVAPHSYVRMADYWGGFYPPLRQQGQLLWGTTHSSRMVQGEKAQGEKAQGEKVQGERGSKGTARRRAKGMGFGIRRRNRRSHGSSPPACGRRGAEGGCRRGNSGRCRKDRTGQLCAGLSAPRAHGWRAGRPLPARRD